MVRIYYNHKRECTLQNNVIPLLIREFVVDPYSHDSLTTTSNRF